MIKSSIFGDNKLEWIAFVRMINIGDLRMKLFYFFNSNGSGNRPYLFDKGHTIALIIIALSIISIYAFKNQILKLRYENHIRYAIAMISILNQIIYNIWAIKVNRWSLQYSLPIHLCTIASFLVHIC